MWTNVDWHGLTWTDVDWSGLTWAEVEWCGLTWTCRFGSSGSSACLLQQSSLISVFFSIAAHRGNSLQCCYFSWFWSWSWAWSWCKLSNSELWTACLWPRTTHSLPVMNVPASFILIELGPMKSWGSPMSSQSERGGGTDLTLFIFLFYCSWNNTNSRRRMLIGCSEWWTVTITAFFSLLAC